MKRLLHQVNRDERGAIALIVALCLVVFFGMAVLVVDLGALIVKHRGLVNANDAAAVAAAASFARNEGDAAAGAADELARANVSDAEHDTEDWFTVTPGFDLPGCDESSCGSVKVRYKAGQAMFFGPAIGLGDRVTAHGSATAIWGPAGGGEPFPITIHDEWLESRVDGGQCDARVPSEDIGTDCAFWLDGRDSDDGDEGDASEGANAVSQWAWIDLERWNVGSSGCPGDEPSDLAEWIAGDEVPVLRVNRPPNPTYVCTAAGRPGKPKYFRVLEEQEGKFKVFPVNDAGGQVGDKYNIVGFTNIEIEDALRGDDPLAVGDPGITNCSWEPVDLEQGQPVDLDDPDQTCSLTNLRHPDPPHPPYPKVRKGSDEFVGGIIGECEGPEFHYCYDPGPGPGEHEITWLRPEPLDDATIEWQSVEPTEGKCGIRPPDDRAVCLVVSWQGYRSGGINPGGGVDFGLRAVRLSA